MHYEVKVGVNKIDSNQNRNLQVPEIDVALNQAEEVFKLRHTPYVDPTRGIERNQRSIDNLRTIIVNQDFGQEVIDGVAALPDDYDYYISSYATSVCGKCSKDIRTTVFRHQDEFREFEKPSFAWGEVPIRFFEKGIRVYTDDTFDVIRLKLNYLRKTKWMHNAEDWSPDGYDYNNTTYTGTQNCELPERAHREIVDLAVLIITGNLTPPNFENKAQIMQLNN